MRTSLTFRLAAKMVGWSRLSSFCEKDPFTKGKIAGLQNGLARANERITELEAEINRKTEVLNTVHCAARDKRQRLEAKITELENEIERGRTNCR